MAYDEGAEIDLMIRLIELEEEINAIEECVQRERAARRVLDILQNQQPTLKEVRSRAVREVLKTMTGVEAAEVLELSPERISQLKHSRRSRW